METVAEASLSSPVMRRLRAALALRLQRLIQIGIVVAAIAVWEFLGRVNLLYGLIPTSGATVYAAWALLWTGKIWPDIATSAYEIGIATLISIVCGVLAGLVLAPIMYLRKVFEPIIVYVGSIPKIILFPIALLFLGIGLESKIALGALSGFVPVVLNTLVGFREVDEKYVRMAKSKGANRFQLYQKVYLPAMTYPIFAGIRLGLGVAITGALLAETKVANRGLGFLAHYYYDRFSVDQMYAVLLIIFLSAAAINLVMTAVLTRLTRFRASDIEQKGAIT